MTIDKITMPIQVRIETTSAIFALDKIIKDKNIKYRLTSANIVDFFIFNTFPL